MPLDKLSKRFCPILTGCKRRGDLIGKKNLKEIKTIESAKELTCFFKQKFEVGDIICMKHYMKYYNNTSSFNTTSDPNRSQYEEENSLDLNNLQVQPTTSFNNQEKDFFLINISNESNNEDAINIQQV